jgi:hypothetical protein
MSEIGDASISSEIPADPPEWWVEMQAPREKETEAQYRERLYWDWHLYYMVGMKRVLDDYNNK